METPNAPTPPPAAPAPKRRIIVIGVLLLVLAAAVAVLLKRSPAAPEALPTATNEAGAATLPLPSAAEMASAYGGLSANTTQQSLVTKVGNQIIRGSEAAKLAGGARFYVLAEENRINVFAMPDGTIFITSLLLNRLKTEGELAAMLAHEVAQISAKHRPSYLATGEIVFTREQEIRADADAVKLMSQAGYDPTALINVLMMMRDIHMTVPVEFFTSHPSPVNRIARIEYAIKQQFPDGVPASLSD